MAKATLYYRDFCLQTTYNKTIGDCVIVQL